MDKVNLQSDELPDVAQIPFTPEAFEAATGLLTPAQIKQIANPDILDVDQRLLYDLYCKLLKIPFPKLIKIAERGQIK